MTTHLFFYPDMQTRDSILEEAQARAREGTDCVMVHFHAYDDRENPDQCSLTVLHRFFTPSGAKTLDQSDAGCYL